MNRYTVAFQHADPIPDRSGVTDRHGGSPSAVQHRSTATPAAANDSDKLPPDSDLLQRPPTTSLPGVRIEGLDGG